MESLGELFNESLEDYLQYLPKEISKETLQVFLKESLENQIEKFPEEVCEGALSKI